MFTAQQKWKSQDDRRKVGWKPQDRVDIGPEEATKRHGLALAQQPSTWVFDLILYLLLNIGQATQKCQPILIFFLYCSDSPKTSSDDEVPDGPAGEPAQGQAGVAGAGSSQASRGGRIFTWAGYPAPISSPDTSCSRCDFKFVSRSGFQLIRINDMSTIWITLQMK